VKRSNLHLAFGATLLVAAAITTSTAAQTPATQSGKAITGGLQAMQQASTGSEDAPACAPCHKAVVDGFTANPHSGPAPVPGDKAVTCASCHGPSKAHEGSGGAAAIFDPANAPATVVDERCKACHGSKHTSFERSSHRQGNVSCVSCHSVHSAGAPKHLLKLAQSELCYKCHSDIKPQFSMRFRHKVAEGVIQCTDCHEAHDDDRGSRHRTAAWQFDVCTMCHATPTGPFVYQHAAVEAEGCTACHFPHGGPNSKLLIRANVNEICQQCHSPSLNSTTGQPAAPSHARSVPGQFCTNCHSKIHGSNASHLFLNAAQEKGDR